MGNLKEIKAIPVWSFALIVALVLAITMFVVGIIMSILGVSMFSMMPFFNTMPMMDKFSHMYAGMAALYFILIMPLMMFICGLLIAALAAFIYNLLAPRIGGIKLNLE